MVSPEIEQYVYSNNDFNFNSTFAGKSKFDEHLCETWKQLMENGVFRYNLNEVKRKIIPGKYGIVAQLNSKRFSERRAPQEAEQVVMPFNENKFNFNKIQSQEILFELKNQDKQGEYMDRIIINISPIEFGHILLVPDQNACHPQVLNTHAIEVASEVMLLSNDPGFCMGYNSMCAFASVNHLHLHAFYIDQTIPSFLTTGIKLNSWLFSGKDHMINVYIVELEDGNIRTFAESIIKVTEYMTTNNIAHNVFICRRKCGEMKEEKKLSCFIFPKKLFCGVNVYPFFAAVLECAGFIPIKDEVEFNNMTEPKAVEILNKSSYNDQEFHSLTTSLLAVL